MKATVLAAALIALGPLGHQSEESIDIAVGETVDILELVLSFNEVTRDSRCPRDVQCIVAGEAIVVFAARNAGEIYELTFEVPPGGTDSQTAGPYTVTVEELVPEPDSTRKIETSDYIATVSIAKQ